MNQHKLLSKRLFILTTLCALMVPAALLAQPGAPVSDTTTRRDAIRVFIDCMTCDMNYIREEMPYINYVRDVKEAQVYLLVTRQTTGSGGTNYTLFYTGQENFAGMRDTLTYASRPDDQTAITRANLTKTMSAGFLRYVAKTPIFNQVQISYQGARQEAPQQVNDRWNYWVFELQTMPRLSMEKSLESFSWTNSASADRVTPELKLQNSFSQSYSKNVYIREVLRMDTVTDTEKLVEFRTEAIRKSWSFSNLTVKSLGNHWSTGFRLGAQSSTYSNLDLQLSVAPAIEYNIFPYSESTRKQLRIQYGIGYKYNRYIDTTLYEKIQEKLFEHSLDLAFQVQQSWGSANISLGASNYLHDFEKYNVELDGTLRLRIFKGLSLNLNGSVEFIHNQIELAKGRISDEDLYLRLRALETGYRYEASVGLTYTFGSIFNNIVNPRFGGGGGYGQGIGSGGMGGGQGMGGGGYGR